MKQATTSTGWEADVSGDLDSEAWELYGAKDKNYEADFDLRKYSGETEHCQEDTRFDWFLLVVLYLMIDDWLVQVICPASSNDWVI